MTEVAQRPRRRRLPFIALAGLTFFAGSAAAQQQRPLQVDDLFRLEKLSTVAVSPDGELVAYVRIAPEEVAPFHDLTYMWGNERGEVWVAPTRGGEPRKIAGDARAGVGFWNPEWSPDGRYLSLLGSNGDNVHVHVWDRDSGALRQVSDRAVESFPAPSTWLSASELVVQVMHEGGRPLSLTIMRNTPEIASREWAKVRAGKEVTASVLESGVPADAEPRPSGTFLLYDARTGRTRLLAEGAFTRPSRAPGGDAVAVFIEVEPFRPKADRLIEHSQQHGRFHVRVFGRTGALPNGGLEQVTRALPGSIEWSPDGNRFAFAGTTVPGDDAPASILAFVPASGELVRYDLGDLELSREVRDWISPPALRWTVDNELLVYARKAGTDRSDWWVLGSSGPARNLTAKLANAPAEIYRVAGGRDWVGISGDEVWRFGPSGEPVDLTAGINEPVTGFAWVDQAQAGARGVGEVVIRTGKKLEEIEYYRISLSGREEVERLAKPKATAELAAYVAAAGQSVFRAADRTGTYLWFASRGAQVRTILETNTFLRGIAEAEARRIEYRGLDGDSLFGWILLPPGYQEGKRYPVVAEVYAGSVARPDRPTILTRLNEPHPLNYQLLAARGYVVLFPSMPLEPEGKASDPFMELTKGVLPALDKLIDLGIADPDRLAVMGQSFGGFSTMGLIAQTTRFKAAVALAGPTDFVSIYGQFDARRRYDDRPHDNLFYFSISETGQVRMGNPPWKDLQRYIRNSPLTYVERVRTPLLIIMGDLDYVALQQGEQYFLSLYRQGKRARFIRYWGEDHVLMSPANIRHMWEQIFDWLGEHLKVETEQRTTAAAAAAAGAQGASH
ncbi:MAG TPA: prolyl oligopeptidase family serine peptidase [Longimicrobiales bacterium]|nr:prolyl oligopeptidase family serine peptidase [Longimicrobiales bacterium]